MRKAFLVAKREYLASVRTKGFIIGLVVAPLFMGGSGIAFAIFKNRVDTTDKKAAIVDYSGIVADALVEAAEERNAKDIFHLESGQKIRPAYKFEIVEPNMTDPATQRLELSNRVRAGELHAFIEIGPDVLRPQLDSADVRIEYYAKNAAMDDFRSWLRNPINHHLRRARIAAAGVTDSAANGILSWIDVQGMGLVSVDETTGQVGEARQASKAEALLVPVVFTLLIYLMIMMGAIPLLSTVMEEKTQRIAEVLLSSVKPFDFMMGKVLGGIGVALTASAVYIIGGTVALTYAGFGQYIPFYVIPWFIVYLLLAITMFGAVNAALGATCNDMKDAGNLTFPAMVPVILPLFVMIPVAKEPVSAFSTWLSLFPPFVPTLMTLRMCTPTGVPLWQPWVALIGLAACTLFAVWAASRIFRVGILMQGKPPNLPNLIRWALKG